MPTVAQVEEQIYACEGFRVRLTPLKPGTKTIPSYDFLVMAPQRWRLSDWKTIRLRPYVQFLRDAVALRGDETPLKTDVQLGRLRDTYYEAKYGSVDVNEASSAAAAGATPAVTPLRRSGADASSPAEAPVSRRKR